MRALKLGLMLLATSGCVGTDVGNPPGDDERQSMLQFRAVDTDVTEASALAIEFGRVDVAWLSVESVRLQRECDGPTTRIDGPFYVDLLSGEILPSPVNLEADGEVCRLNLDLGPAGLDAPSELVGLSVLAVGEGEEGSVTLESDTERVLPYNGQGFRVGEGRHFIDAFDASGWFAKPAHGESRVGVFLSALKHDSRIVEDVDDDGEVSRAEYIEPVALPRP